MCIGTGVHLSIEKVQLTRVSRYYLTIEGSTAVFIVPSQNLSMFFVIYILAKGRYRVHY